MLDGLLVLAQEAAPQARSWWQAVLDNTLGLTVLFVFLVAVIAALVSARKRDRCLKRLHKFRVTVREQNGREVWGELRVFSNALEVRYSEPPPDRVPAKRSFLYYQSELAGIYAVTHYVDELADDAERTRRRRQLGRMARPGLLTRTGRSIRNLFGTLRDAIVQSLGLAIAEAQKHSRNRAMQVGGGQMSTVGGMLVGEAANAYEPMLEQYFGDPVVAELTHPVDKSVVELAGYLGEYSSTHVLLVDCEQTAVSEIAVPIGSRLALSRHLTAERVGATEVCVRHGGAFPATVIEVVCGEDRRVVDVSVPPGGEATVALGGEIAADTAIRLRIRTRRRVDVVAPRTVAVVRHAGDEPAGVRESHNERLEER